MAKLLGIILVAIALIMAIILIKYKISYKVKISGEEVGYISDKKAFEENIEKKVIESEEKNVDSVILTTEPEYEIKLVEKQEKTNEEEIIAKIEDSIQTTYKYYEIAVSNVTVDSVDTIEDAEQLVNEIKNENENADDLDLSIIEKYTDNVEEVTTNEVEVAKANVTSKVTQDLVAIQKQKEEEERLAAMPVINEIKLAYVPVQGTLTSRYGERSSIRSSVHTGLDIAAPSGTPIQAVAGGIIIEANYSGSYGNLVKIDHGNGVETWYAHTSKMYVTVGQTVNAGDVIAAVGSTGNSTGAHLHLEIRVNGNTVNPQSYLYN